MAFRIGFYGGSNDWAPKSVEGLQLFEGLDAEFRRAHVFALLAVFGRFVWKG